MHKYLKRSLQIGIPVAILAGLAIPKLNPGGGTKEEGMRPGGKQGALPVTGVVAKNTVSTNGINANGTLLANEEVELVAETVGKVRGIYFKEGAVVRKGDLLLKVDDSDLQAQLSRAEFQEKLLREKLDRQRILLERESISREAFDQLQTDYNMLKADIELLKVKINRTEIRAPFDGQMGFRYISEGSYVQPSSQVTRIVDNSVLKFEFGIPEKYAARKLSGEEFTFTVGVDPRRFTARIYAVDPSVSLKTRTVSVRARFDNRERLLMPGMFAKGFLLTGENLEYMQIPTEAVVPQMDGKRMWVVKRGKAVLVPVETNSRDRKSVEVMSGINPGDTVLTGGLLQLREGMAVKVDVKN